MFVLGFGMNHVGPEVVTTVSNHSFLGSVSEVAFLGQGGPWSLSLSLCFLLGFLKQGATLCEIHVGDMVLCQERPSQCEARIWESQCCGGFTLELQCG